MAQVLKEEGNRLLAANDFEDKYSAAIALSPGTAALHSNRALARFLQGKHAASLEDAEECVRLKREWLKGHFHRVRALAALGRAEEAQAAFSAGAEEAGGKDSPEFAALEPAVTAAYVRHHYAPLTADLAVEVRYIDSERGKGLFATQPVRMFRAIFAETPLVSHRKLPAPEAPEACSHCLRFFVTRQQAERTKLGPLFFGEKSARVTPQWLYCEECAKRAPEMRENDPQKIRDPFLRGNPFFLEKYCGEACREAAREQYHAVLCGAAFVSDEKRVHPLHHLYNLCVESQRSNPLMICRIFAMVFQKIVSGRQSPELALQEFRNFVGGEEVSPVDEMAVFLLKNMYLEFPFMESIVTLSNYRRLNSAILRNAQTVTPVSDLHAWFEAELAREEGLLERLRMTPEDLKHYMAKPEMTDLCKVEGMALLAVANCMNHSCDPNVIASSSHNDHTATFVALRPIEIGEELCISYVDDALPWEERQRLLKQFYRFECKCIRCHVQKEKIPIIQ